MIETIISKARETSKNPGNGKGGKSIVMPLFGTGQAGCDPSVLAARYIEAAINALSDSNEAALDGDINLVVFCAYSDDDAELLKRLFNAFEKDGEIKRVSKHDVP